MLQEQTDIIFYYVAGTLFITLLVVFVFVYIYVYYLRTKQIQSERAKEELAKQQELYFALQVGEEKERKRLAEELHDGIGAKLSGLKMNLEYLRNGAGKNTFEHTLEKIIDEIDNSINEVRELSQNLKPAFISAQNLKSALTRLIDNLSVASSIEWQIEVSIQNDPPIDFKLSIYRMIAELLNNIYKHAGATRAFIHVIEEEKNIQILVEDNGKGIAKKISRDGNGLTNLRSRVTALKGKFEIDSSDQGTSVIIDLPVYQ
ncbi:MAG: sensor histidine kinase [Bacteroidota bacterium]